MKRGNKNKNKSKNSGKHILTSVPASDFQTDYTGILPGNNNFKIMSGFQYLFQVQRFGYLFFLGVV